MSTCSNKTPEFLTGDLFARRATLSRLEPEQEYYVTEENGKTYLYIGGPNGEALLVPSVGISDIDGLQTELDNRVTDAELVAGLATKANVSHTHVISDVTGLQTALDGKVNTYFIDIRDFGASIDGVTDDLPALKAAFNSVPSGGKALIQLPAGDIYLDLTSGSGVEVEDKFISLVGAGKKQTRLMCDGVNTAVFFRFVRTGVETAHYFMKGFQAEALNADNGTFLQQEEERPLTDTHAVGGVELATYKDISLEGDADGYWTVQCHLINAGGINIRGWNGRNVLAAQSNTNTKGFYLENNQSNIFVINAFTLSDFYLQRVDTAFHLDVINSIETFNIDQYEVVGARRGFYAEGGGVVATINFGAGHWDCTQSVGSHASDTGLQKIDLGTADMQIGNNGGTPTSGSVFEVTSGEQLTANGVTFSSYNGADPSGTYKGLVVGGNFFRFSIGPQNIYRNCDTSVEIAGTANNGNLEQGIEIDAGVPVIITTNKATVSYKRRFVGMRVQASLNDNFLVNDDVETPIQWDLTRIDDFGAWSATNPERITVPAGVTRVKLSGQVWPQDRSSGAFTVGFRKNGADVPGSVIAVRDVSDTTTDIYDGHTATLDVAEGDILTMTCRQTSGGALLLQGGGVLGFYNWFEMEVV